MTKHEVDTLVDTLLKGKLPRNLAWTDVVTMIEHIGTVEPHGQEFAFTVGTQREFFKKPHGHDLDVNEVSLLRKFLHSAFQPGGAQKPATGRTVVVVDHHESHVYRENGESVPAPEGEIKPYDSRGFHRHLTHRKEAHYSGERVPEEDSYYDGIAKELASANSIVLIGSGTGTSSAVDYLMDFLKKHHGNIAQRVVAVEKVDLSALTLPEIEQLAKHA